MQLKQMFSQHFSLLYLPNQICTLSVRCAVTTFSTLHGFDEDPSTVGKHPVPAAVAVLAIHRGAQRMGNFKQLSSGLVMLLQTYKTFSVVSLRGFD